MQGLKQRYKYVHILLRNSKMFHTRLAKCLGNEEYGFNKAEHLYVVFQPDAYENLKELGDVLLVTKNPDKPERVINEWAKKCDWIFMHALDYTARFMYVKRKYLKKIIWRSWGHDGKISYSGNKITVFLKKLFNLQHQINKRIEKFKAIGVANLIDVIDLNERFKDYKKIQQIPKVMISYPEVEGKSALEPIDDYFLQDDNCLKVLIGHSGYYTDKHLEVLEQFKGLDLTGIKLYLLISYGQEDYIREIKNYVSENGLQENVVFVEDFLPIAKYNYLISKMDVGILNGEGSYAIGCFSRLITDSKKIYLNKNGVLAKALDVVNIPHFYVQDIKKNGINEFVKKVEYDGRDTLLSRKDKEFHVQKWRDLLDWLDGKEVDVDISKNID